MKNHGAYGESNSHARGTRGTETSKYPEEEKSNEIPQVVASESGRGQTIGSNIDGVGTVISTVYPSRMVWESQSKSVRIT